MSITTGTRTARRSLWTVRHRSACRNCRSSSATGVLDARVVSPGYFAAMGFVKTRRQGLRARADALRLSRRCAESRGRRPLLRRESRRRRDHRRLGPAHPDHRGRRVLCSARGAEADGAGPLHVHDTGFRSDPDADPRCAACRRRHARRRAAGRGVSRGWKGDAGRGADTGSPARENVARGGADRHRPRRGGRGDCPDAGRDRHRWRPVGVRAPAPP